MLPLTSCGARGGVAPGVGARSPGGEGAADLAQDGGGRQVVRPLVGVGQQRRRGSRAGGCGSPPGAAPARATRCGWRPGRRWGCRPAPGARPPRTSASNARSRREPRGVWMERLSSSDEGDPAPRRRAGQRAAELGAEGRGPAAAARAQSNQPSRQSTRPKPYALAVGPGRLHQALPPAPLRHHTRVRVGCRATSTSSCRYRSAPGSSASRRGRSSGTRSARVGSGTRSSTGGGSGDAAAASRASTLSRFFPRPANLTGGGGPPGR